MAQRSPKSTPHKQSKPYPFGGALEARGRFTIADEELMRPPTLRNVAVAVDVAKRWKAKAMQRAYAPGGGMYERLKREWGEDMGGDEAD